MNLHKHNKSFNMTNKEIIVTNIFVLNPPPPHGNKGVFVLWCTGNGALPASVTMVTEFPRSGSVAMNSNEE